MDWPPGQISPLVTAAIVYFADCASRPLPGRTLCGTFMHVTSSARQDLECVGFCGWQLHAASFAGSGLLCLR